MADGLDVVAVEVVHEGAVVRRVVLSRTPGRAVVEPACGERRLVEASTVARSSQVKATCVPVPNGSRSAIQKLAASRLRRSPPPSTRRTPSRPRSRAARAPARRTRGSPRSPARSGRRGRTSILLTTRRRRPGAERVGRAVVDRLDIVAVRVEYVGRVVARVIRALARRAVVACRPAATAAASKRVDGLRVAPACSAKCRPRSSAARRR